MTISMDSNFMLNNVNDTSNYYLNSLTTSSATTTPLISPRFERPLDCNEQIKSANILIETQKINVYSTMIIIIIGLLGNGLAVFVFMQKRFRIHSSSIYLLCLAISDGLFLLMHFFEDTLRTYIDIYLNGEHSNVNKSCFLTNAEINSLHINSNKTNLISNQTNVKSSVIINHILRQINITDQFDFSCRLVNYFRYFLRFLSAYIIVVFTIQRCIAIHFPFFQAKFESNFIAWCIIVIVTLIGAITNAWVPFLFKPREIMLDPQMNYSIEYCDVQKEYSSSYFMITITYIIITMLIPIVIIFLCNFLIIFFLIKAGKERKALQNSEMICKKPLVSSPSTNIQSKCEETSLLSKSATSNNIVAKQHKTSNFNGNINHNSNNHQRKHGTNGGNSNDSNKITKMLILMSFSYAILNLPYFISWCLFFYNIAFKKLDKNPIGKNYLFSALNICEIFYITNYGIHFFIYCASGKKFRSHLKDQFTFLK